MSENNYAFQPSGRRGSSETTGGISVFFEKVFAKMGAGLLVSTLAAWLSYRSYINEGIIHNLYNSIGELCPFILIGIMFIYVTILHKGLNNPTEENATKIKFGYYIFCILNGVTLFYIPLLFDGAVIFTALLFAGVMFGAAATIGKLTNIDLSKLGGILFGGLIALITITILSLFIEPLRNSLLINYIGTLLFLLYTMYDMQSIKRFYSENSDNASLDILSTYGALQLYLDFVNIFLYILEILSARDSKD